MTVLKIILPVWLTLLSFQGTAQVLEIVNPNGYVRLDMEGSLKNPRAVKLSDLGKEVVYHRLGEIPLRVRYIYSIPGGYFVQSLTSLRLFDENFKPVRVLIEEEIERTGKGRSRRNKINASLLHTYYLPQTNTMNGVITAYDNEPEPKIRMFIGSIALDSLLQTTVPAKLDIVKQRIRIKNNNYHLSTRPPVLPVGDGYFTTGKFNKELYTFSAKGDTLCRFQIDFDNDTEKALEGKSVIRNAERNTAYTYKGYAYFRPAYTNKLYRIKDACTLEPVYMIDFGEHQLKQSEGVNADFNLSGKFILNSWLETDDLIYIRFTRNYDCPNTREDKSVEFHQAIYNKRNKEFFSYTDHTNISEPAAIPNDIDGGPDFWPTHHIDGKPYMLVRGKTLKEGANREKLSNVPALNDITDDESILITIN